MVVLAASLVTKNGKALVSRQFVDMSRIRIEGLLAAFPKLVGSGKQHTFVETNNVGYVYHPLEGLYLLLVTNKQSNILEDLETLRLLSKVVPMYVDPVDEETISKNAFELIFAFDEVISCGLKENITAQQVKQNTEMDCHEEKLHKMIIQSKIKHTKDVMKRKAMEIEKTKMERNRLEGKSSLSQFASTLSSMGSGPIMSKMVSSDNSDNMPSFAAPESRARAPAASYGGKDRGPSKGMQLGKGKKSNNILASLQAEGESVEVDTPPGRTANSAAVSAAPASSTDPVYIVVEEKLQVLLNKDGGVENMEVQGTISLEVKTDDACLRVTVTSNAGKEFQFKTHPNIDKGLYGSDSVLGLKDPTRPFPTGSPLGILEWRMATKDESRVPLTINCWPSVSGGESYVNIEYESQAEFDLCNVVIAIPVNTAPSVTQVDGDYRYDSRKGMLLWNIDIIDSANNSGAMEFKLPAVDSDSFFPWRSTSRSKHSATSKSDSSARRALRQVRMRRAADRELQVS
uniref:Coatomer subunit delta n=1 Tax=Scherffelia dubia TaxID=3190 RepID=Q94IK3_SCHDU|nr:coatomer delta subunit [Scherffelia dubia]